MQGNCDTNYLCVWMEYYLCAMNKVIQGPTGPMGPRGPQGVPGPQGPPGQSGISNIANALRLDETDPDSPILKWGGELVDEITTIQGDGLSQVNFETLSQIGIVTSGGASYTMGGFNFAINDAAVYLSSGGDLYGVLQSLGSGIFQVSHVNDPGNILHLGTSSNFLRIFQTSGFYRLSTAPPIGNSGMKVLVFDPGEGDSTEPNIKITDFPSVNLTLKQNIQAGFFDDGLSIVSTLYNVPYPTANPQAIVGITSNGTNYSSLSRTVSVPTGSNTYLWINYTIPTGGSGLSGHGLSILVLLNGEIIYSTTLVDIVQGATGTIATGIPALPVSGIVEVMVVDNQFDTNGPSAEQGVLTVGGKYILDGEYAVTLTLSDSGGPNPAFTSTPNTKYWPNREEADLNYINYKTVVYSNNATGGVLNITKTATYNNSQTVRVTFKASVDSSLDFVDTINHGMAYVKNLALSVAQLDSNDFMITIEPI